MANNTHGVINDADAIFVLSMIAKNIDVILENKDDGFTLSDALATVFDDVDVKDQSSEQSKQNWIERLSARVSISGLYRQMFAQRMCEIFPALNNSGLIWHKTNVDTDGSDTKSWGIRINPNEIFSDLIVPILNQFSKEEYLALRKERQHKAELKVKELTQTMDSLRKITPNDEIQKPDEWEDSTIDISDSTNTGLNFEELMKTKTGQEKIQEYLNKNKTQDAS